uniref:formylglycine-generating enzyme family protein n=1 Tax=Mesotoga sp. TaxID=2053577 RepID=UPI0026063A79
VNGLLKDFCPEEPRGKIFAITQCLREGIAKELIDSSKRKTIRIEMSRFSKRMQDDFGMKEEISTWSVDSIALALKLTSEEEVTKVMKKTSSRVIEQRSEHLGRRTFAEKSNETRAEMISANRDELVFVECGSFLMSDGRGKEGHSHELTLTQSYYIGKYPVTFEEYDRYCDEKGTRRLEDENWGRGRRPVINVSWWDAISYCNWLSEKEGIRKAYDDKGNFLDKDGRTTTDPSKVFGYRLPTEAEWEYAARGGKKSKGYKYAGSDNPDLVAWYTNNSGSKTQEVGQKKRNELGMFDMSGNIWEWCSDFYGGYSNIRKTNPFAFDGSRRVSRGGAWYSEVFDLLLTCRNAILPEKAPYYVGFRLCLTIS